MSGDERKGHSSDDDKWLNKLVKTELPSSSSGDDASDTKTLSHETQKKRSNNNSHRSLNYDWKQDQALFNILVEKGILQDTKIMWKDVKEAFDKLKLPINRSEKSLRTRFQRHVRYRYGEFTDNSEVRKQFEKIIGQRDNTESLAGPSGVQREQKKDRKRKRKVSDSVTSPVGLRPRIARKRTRKGTNSANTEEKSDVQGKRKEKKNKQPIRILEVILLSRDTETESEGQQKVVEVKQKVLPSSDNDSSFRTTISLPSKEVIKDETHDAKKSPTETKKQEPERLGDPKNKSENNSSEIDLVDITQSSASLDHSISSQTSLDDGNKSPTKDITDQSETASLYTSETGRSEAVVSEISDVLDPEDSPQGDLTASRIVPSFPGDGNAISIESPSALASIETPASLQRYSFYLS